MRSAEREFNSIYSSMINKLADVSDKSTKNKLTSFRKKSRVGDTLGIKISIITDEIDKFLEDMSKVMDANIGDVHASLNDTMDSILIYARNMDRSDAFRKALVPLFEMGDESKLKDYFIENEGKIDRSMASHIRKYLGEYEVQKTYKELRKIPNDLFSHESTKKHMMENIRHLYDGDVTRKKIEDDINKIDLGNDGNRIKKLLDFFGEAVNDQEIKDMVEDGDISEDLEESLDIVSEILEGVLSVIEHKPLDDKEAEKEVSAPIKETNHYFMSLPYTRGILSDDDDDEEEFIVSHKDRVKAISAFEGVSRSVDSRNLKSLAMRIAVSMDLLSFGVNKSYIKKFLRNGQLVDSDSDSGVSIKNDLVSNDIKIIENDEDEPTILIGDRLEFGSFILNDQQVDSVIEKIDPKKTISRKKKANIRDITSLIKFFSDVNERYGKIISDGYTLLLGVIDDVIKDIKKRLDVVIKYNSIKGSDLRKTIQIKFREHISEKLFDDKYESVEEESNKLTEIINDRVSELREFPLNSVENLAAIIDPSTNEKQSLLHHFVSDLNGLVNELKSVSKHESYIWNFVKEYIRYVEDFIKHVSYVGKSYRITKTSKKHSDAESEVFEILSKISDLITKKDGYLSKLLESLNNAAYKDTSSIEKNYINSTIENILSSTKKLRESISKISFTVEDIDTHVKSNATTIDRIMSKIKSDIMGFISVESWELSPDMEIAEIFDSTSGELDRIVSRMKNEKTSLHEYGNIADGLKNLIISRLSGDPGFKTRTRQRIERVISNNLKDIIGVYTAKLGQILSSHKVKGIPTVINKYVAISENGSNLIFDPSNIDAFVNTIRNTGVSDNDKSRWESIGALHEWENVFNRLYETVIRRELKEGKEINEIEKKFDGLKRDLDELNGLSKAKYKAKVNQISELNSDEISTLYDIYDDAVEIKLHDNAMDKHEAEILSNVLKKNAEIEIDFNTDQSIKATLNKIRSISPHTHIGSIIGNHSEEYKKKFATEASKDHNVWMVNIGTSGVRPLLISKEYTGLLKKMIWDDKEKKVLFNDTDILLNAMESITQNDLIEDLEESGYGDEEGIALKEFYKQKQNNISLLRENEASKIRISMALKGILDEEEGEMETGVVSAEDDEPGEKPQQVSTEESDGIKDKVYGQTDEDELEENTKSDLFGDLGISIDESEVDANYEFIYKYVDENKYDKYIRNNTTLVDKIIQAIGSEENKDEKNIRFKVNNLIINSNRFKKSVLDRIRRHMGEGFSTKGLPFKNIISSWINQNRDTLDNLSDPEVAAEEISKSIIKDIESGEQKFIEDSIEVQEEESEEEKLSRETTRLYPEPKIIKKFEIPEKGPLLDLYKILYEGYPVYVGSRVMRKDGLIKTLQRHRSLSTDENTVEKIKAILYGPIKLEKRTKAEKLKKVLNRIGITNDEMSNDEVINKAISYLSEGRSPSFIDKDEGDEEFREVKSILEKLSKEIKRIIEIASTTRAKIDKAVPDTNASKTNDVVNEMAMFNAVITSFPGESLKRKMDAAAERKIINKKDGDYRIVKTEIKPGLPDSSWHKAYELFEDFDGGDIEFSALMKKIKNSKNGIFVSVRSSLRNKLKSINDSLASQIELRNASSKYVDVSSSHEHLDATYSEEGKEIEVFPEMVDLLLDLYKKAGNCPLYAHVVHKVCTIIKNSDTKELMNRHHSIKEMIKSVDVLKKELESIGQVKYVSMKGGTGKSEWKKTINKIKDGVDDDGLKSSITEIEKILEKFDIGKEVYKEKVHDILRKNNISVESELVESLINLFNEVKKERYESVSLGGMIKNRERYPHEVNRAIIDGDKRREFDIFWDDDKISKEEIT